MGRGRKRKTRRELRRQVNNTNQLMGRNALDQAWYEDGCDHPAPTVSLYGLAALLSCEHCGRKMQFLLKFGRRKTMDVSIYDDDDPRSVRPVGRATLKGSRDMIMSHATTIFMPKDGADPQGGQPERDKAMLGVLMEVMAGPEDVPPPPPGDFGAAWLELDCDHRTVSCQVLGKWISLECRDCAAELTFEHAGGDRFDVRVTRLPLEPVPYGRHHTTAVVKALREFTDKIELPTTMADKMSDDPERDARRLAKVVITLERHGLLKRVPAPDHPNIRMIQTVSALTCNREEFNGWKGPLAEEMRRRGVKCTSYGKPVSAESTLEAMRLTWPCVLEGVGVTRDAFDVTGLSEYCVKCGFSTLDDNKVDFDHWERGCPECGYPGWLVGLEDDGEVRTGITVIDR